MVVEAVVWGAVAEEVLPASVRADCARAKVEAEAGAVGKQEISAAEKGEKRKGEVQVERWWRRWPPVEQERERERDHTPDKHTHTAHTGSGHPFGLKAHPTISSRQDTRVFPSVR